jgi:hypothetical protein
MVRARIRSVGHGRSGERKLTWLRGMSSLELIKVGIFYKYLIFAAGLDTALPFTTVKGSGREVEE